MQINRYIQKRNIESKVVSPPQLYVHGKDNSLFSKVLPNICQNSFLHSPNLFLAKLYFLKVYQ